ncbi:MAG: sigma-70 family RNA polymerase sigma factor [Candidatus Kapabacteria bacterium]|jgi:RNA polymerase sigma-70 factor (ECF subfamily)|nr:sigma-70 family RNA polymerase sigma factor [Candidatus Kapabacteria bacterium]
MSAFQQPSTSTREAEFVRLLEENKARIMRLCKAYTTSREDREDLFQEIAVQLWKALPGYRGEAQVSTWMYRIALNVSLRFSYETKRRKPSAERISWIEETTPHPHDDATRERIEQLQRCITSLPEVERSVMILYLEECSYKEISAITGLTETNVGVKISRIKEKLLGCMQRGEGGAQ